MDSIPLEEFAVFDQGCKNKARYVAGDLWKEGLELRGFVVKSKRRVRGAALLM